MTGGCPLANPPPTSPTGVPPPQTALLLAASIPDSVLNHAVTRLLLTFSQTPEAEVIKCDSQTQWPEGAATATLLGTVLGAARSILKQTPSLDPAVVSSTTAALKTNVTDGIDIPPEATSVLSTAISSCIEAAPHLVSHLIAAIATADRNAPHHFQKISYLIALALKQAHDSLAGSVACLQRLDAVAAVALLHTVADTAIAQGAPIAQDALNAMSAAIQYGKELNEEALEAVKRAVGVLVEYVPTAELAEFTAKLSELPAPPAVSGAIDAASQSLDALLGAAKSPESRAALHTTANALRLAALHAGTEFKKDLVQAIAAGKLLAEEQVASFTQELATAAKVLNPCMLAALVAAQNGAAAAGSKVFAQLHVATIQTLATSGPFARELLANPIAQDMIGGMQEAEKVSRRCIAGILLAAKEAGAEIGEDSAEALKKVLEGAEVMGEEILDELPGLLAMANAVLADVDVVELLSTLQQAGEDGFVMLKAIADSVNPDELCAAAANAVETVAETFGDVWESGVLQSAGGSAVEWIKDEGYAMSRSEMEGAMMLAAGVGVAMLDWVKIEVVRDFFQIMSLFFNNLFGDVFETVGKFWGSFGSIAALDLGFLFPSIPIEVVYGLLIVIGVVMMAMFSIFAWQTSFDPDAIRDGYEVQSWKMRSEKAKTCGIAPTKYSLYMMQVSHVHVWNDEGDGVHERQRCLRACRAE